LYQWTCVRVVRRHNDYVYCDYYHISCFDQEKFQRRMCWKRKWSRVCTEGDRGEVSGNEREDPLLVYDFRRSVVRC